MEDEKYEFAGTELPENAYLNAVNSVLENLPSKFKMQMLKKHFGIEVSDSDSDKDLEDLHKFLEEEKKEKAKRRAREQERRKRAGLKY